MTDSNNQIGWTAIWHVVRGSNRLARRRALRETLTVLAVTILPLLLGAFFTYVQASRTEESYPDYFAFAVRATLAGQMFLLFLSIAGTIFARLWDPEGPRYAFSGILNIVCLIGAVITGGLLAIDGDMKTFSWWPVGAMSLLFFIVSMLYYFILAIPSYLEKPDIPKTLSDQGAGLGRTLQERLGGDDA